MSPLEASLAPDDHDAEDLPDWENHPDNPDLERLPYDPADEEACIEEALAAETPERRAELLRWADVDIDVDDTDADWAFESSGAIAEVPTDEASLLRSQMVQNPWLPISAGRLIGEAKKPLPPPVVLKRRDGVALLYLGKLSSISGSPEACKSWFACLAVRDVLRNGGYVVYIDFEDDVVSVVRRLLALGCTEAEIDDQLLVLHPTTVSGWFDDKCERSRKQFRRALDNLRDKLGLIVFDGVTSALALDGIEPNENGEVVRWVNYAASLCETYGCAGLLVDHDPKAEKASGKHSRFAGGAGQKLAGLTGSQFKADVDTVFTPKQPGRITISVTKDRPGRVRENALGDGFVQEIAVMNLEPVNPETGFIGAWLDPPNKSTGAEKDKLSQTKQRLLSYLGKCTSPRTMKELREHLHVRSSDVTDAVEALAADGHVAVTTKGLSKLVELVSFDIDVDDSGEETGDE